MEKSKVVAKYEEELATIQKKIEDSMDNLHDALLGIGQYSVKDMSAAIVKYKEEEKHIQICLDALSR